MRHPLATVSRLVLTAGLAVAVSPVFAQRADADLPINRITMYRSGVAAYERSGFIDGDATLRMLFAEDALDDVLKSLVILDAGGGRVAGVNYTVSEPVSRRLAALGLSAGDLSIDGLLKALKGVRVRLTHGTNTADAVILGVSERNVANPDGGASLQKFVTVMQGATVRSVPVNAIADFEILDPEMRDEFAGVLAELNRQRGELQKAVEVKLRGDDRRRVGAMYVAPAPVWKTSYRLVLGSGSQDQQASLIGMAIVENTSDQDWDDVTLSLVSGRPVGFTMPLSQPVYTRRPTIPVPVELAMAGKLFEAGAAFARSDAAPGEGLASARRSGRGGGIAAMAESAFADTAFDAQSIANTAVASALSGDAGEVFVYTVDAPVSVGRQSSAMIPIINTPVDAERISIYTRGDADRGQENPMRGVRMTNASRLELLAGPITVYDTAATLGERGVRSAGTYQGDARIDRVGRGDERLIAYAQDLDLTVAEQNGTPIRRVDVKIQDGVMRFRRWRWDRTTYTIVNADDDRPRTLVVEHPKLSGYELDSEAEPVETTGRLYRFDVDLDAGETREFTVSQRRMENESYTLSRFDDAVVRRYSSDRSIPENLRRVFVDYAAKRAAITEAKAALASLEKDRATITSDQVRVRENMAALDRQSDLYRRYVSTLSDGENRLDTLKGEIESARDRVEKLETALRDWLRTIDAE
ncbi:MAG: hypothetical protein AAF108_00395 [Planctomycetota bacterium]